MELSHTFAVCAYKESEFLEDCVRSLLAQTVKSRILICTSTPNAHISSIAEKYSLPLFINEGEAGITGDWNFAISHSDTDLTTIAHQDDIYDPTYTEEILAKAKRAKNPIILFTEYYEIRNGEKAPKNTNLKIKGLMNTVFRLFGEWKWARLRVLSMGNSICCPAVTYTKNALDGFKFDRSYRFACDWEAWERLARKKGSFCYIPKPLMGHRIHEESETTKITASSLRSEEEYGIYRKFWPEAIARKLSGLYSKGAESNKL